MTTTVHKALPSGGGAMGSWDGGLGVVEGGSWVDGIYWLRGFRGGLERSRE